MHTQVCQVNGGSKLVRAGGTLTVVWESHDLQTMRLQFKTRSRGILSLLFITPAGNTVGPHKYVNTLASKIERKSKEKRRHQRRENNVFLRG